MVRRSGIEGAEHQIPKMERRCGVRNSPPDGAEVRCAEHQIRMRCPALEILLSFFVLYMNRDTYVSRISKSLLVRYSA